MTMQLGMPLDVLHLGPDGTDVCSSCRHPEHTPQADASDEVWKAHPKFHKYSVRVVPTGFAAHMIGTLCPVCGDDVKDHKWVDLNLWTEAVNCDRYERDYWWEK